VLVFSLFFVVFNLIALPGLASLLLVKLVVKTGTYFQELNTFFLEKVTGFWGVFLLNILVFYFKKIVLVFAL